MSAIASARTRDLHHVPGNQSVAEMEADVLAAFSKIAAFVTLSAKLVTE